jgi:hypothetical protein
VGLSLREGCGRFLHHNKKGEVMKKTKTDVKKRAQELIQELDKLTLSRSQGSEIALGTHFGPIFAWQEHKLENLEFCLEHWGEPDGFISVATDMEDESDVVHIKLKTLPNTENPTLSLLNLLPLSDQVWEEAEEASYFGRDEDVINKDFRKPVCSSCGRDLAAA